MLPWAGTPEGPIQSSCSFAFPREGGLRAGKLYASFQLPAVSFLCRRRENMKCPSRCREASSALQHSPAAEPPASCRPSTSCTYHLGRDTTNLSRSCALPHLQCPPGPIFLVPLPKRALPWVQVRGHLPLGRTQLEHMHQEPAFHLTLLHALHLEPGIQRQNGSAFLHVTTVQPWHRALCSGVNVMMAETAPRCSSQGQHQWPKLLSIVTSGWSRPMPMSAP